MENENLNQPTENQTETAAADRKVIVLLPTDTEGEFSARIFDSKAAVKKALDLNALPAGVLFYQGKKLETKVKTVVSL